MKDLKGVYGNFIKHAVLKVIIDFSHSLIGAEGAQTPAGVRGRGDPTGALAPRRLSATACGKRSAWNGNQQTNLTQSKNKNHSRLAVENDYLCMKFKTSHTLFYEAI